MRRIGILTSGGDAPGMNACIRAVVRSAVLHELDVVGIGHGYRGLMTGNFITLGARSVAEIIHRGGTFLGTARCEEMKTREGRQVAIKFMRNTGITDLVVIGGEGTFKGAVALAKEGRIKVMGIPATIDNDVYGTDYSIGFDTAVNTALQAMDKIRDTAQSLERLFFVEVMGRTRGFIALDLGVAGGATECLVPEEKTDIDALCQTLEHSFTIGKKYALVVVAEGDTPGGAMTIADQVSKKLKLDYRVAVLGHIQRGGAPTARDRILAGKLGVAAVEGLLNGKEGHMVGEIKGAIIYTPLEETWQGRKELDYSLLKLAKTLAE
jgi:6-phosphofructokinase 1